MNASSAAIPSSSKTKRIHESEASVRYECFSASFLALISALTRSLMILSPTLRNQAGALVIGSSFFSIAQAY